MRHIDGKNVRLLRMGLFSPLTRCPSCGQGKVFPSRARSKERDLLWSLGLRTYYRCHDCGWRRARIGLSGRRLRKVLEWAALIALCVFVVVLIYITAVKRPMPPRRGRRSRAALTIPKPPADILCASYIKGIFQG